MSDDKIGSAINLSWQEVIARDIQLMLLHHEPKRPIAPSAATVWTTCTGLRGSRLGLAA